MAALQITYGGSSYDVTRLDIIDLIPFEPVFLQNRHKFFENNITRLDIIDPLPEPVYLQDAQKLFENNITRLDIIDPILNLYFYKEELRVLMPKLQGEEQHKKHLKKAGSNYEFNKNIYKF